MTRRGMSILEIMLAFLILGLAIIPILNLFFGTSRLANRTSSAFRDAVAGQLIWEAVKAQNAINPLFLSQLETGMQFEERAQPHPHRPSQTVRTLVHTGAFVASQGPVDGQGRPLAVSPFATFLFNRSGGDLYTPENRFSLDRSGPHATVTAEEAASLSKNFQDLAVRVSVADALLPDWKPGDPETKPLAANEQLKDVFVDVFHVGPDHRLPAKPTYTLEASLQTPTVSLTIDGVRRLRRDTDDYSYDHEIRAAVAGVRAGIGTTPMGNGMQRVAGDMVLVAVESVGESVLSHGRDLGFRIENGDTGKGSTYYAEKLARIDSAVAALTAADLKAEEAKGIFRAFRRSAQSIEVLNVYASWFGPKLKNVVRALSRNTRTFDSSLSSAAQRDTARERVRQLALTYREDLTQLGFWAVLLSQERWWRALQRPNSYVERYGALLNEAQALYKAAEAHAHATPMDRVRALSGYLEATKAKKMFERARRLTADEDYLRAKAGALVGSMLPFAICLKDDELYDYDRLITRNDLFYATLDRMQRSLGPGSLYSHTLNLLRPNGLLVRYRRRLKEVFDRFGLREFSGEISQEIGELVAQVRDADFPAVSDPQGDGTDTGPTDGDETDDPLDDAPSPESR